MNGIELLVEKKQLNYKENGTAAFLCLLPGVYRIVLLLFFLEMLLKNHMLLYLVTSALLLAAPLFGIRPGIGSLVLLFFFGSLSGPCD